tara:strand:- start:1096 stop:2277 length:1182 start_codon:yes stop_codon:yes gene_type:complete
MNLNFWPKMYYSGGGGGGGGDSGGGGGAGGGGAGGGGAAGGGAGYGGGAGAGGGSAAGGAAGELPPEEPTPVGAFRFNTDSLKLEYWDGNQWVNVTTDSPERHTGAAIGVYMGGSGTTDRIDEVRIATTGDSVDFGNITSSRNNNGDGNMASRVRGFFAQGQSPIAGRIEFITFATRGDGTTFGTMSDSITNGASSASDSTRGLIFGGYAAPATLNVIQYITMASSGNGVDFGDLPVSGNSSAFSSPTRAIGVHNSSNAMSYVTISTLGNAADFGDSTINAGHRAWGSNAIRGVSFGCEFNPSGSKGNVIEFATIATLGNAQDFGDTIQSTIAEGSTMTSGTRAVYCGGITPSGSNVMQYVEIMTKGDAVDFGDLTIARGHGDACSNAHGGLG